MKRPVQRPSDRAAEPGARLAAPAPPRAHKESEDSPMSESAERTVVVAGATGFIGRPLGAVLARRGLKVVGLTRGRGAPPPGYSELRQCDLFSLEDAERALEGARYAVYLVHSMMPSARLTQGGFSDLDLL